MPIPNKILVRDNWITVKKTINIYVDGKSANGSYCGDPEAVIEVDESQKEQKQIGVVVHEIMHAIFDIDPASAFFDDKQEEAVCRMVEQHLGPLVVFNKRTDKLKWKK